MAKKLITVNMDEELVKKLDESAKVNHRKRGPEINVAVEFYLKYGMTDFDSFKFTQQDNEKTVEEVGNVTTESIQPEETPVDDSQWSS